MVYKGPLDLFQVLMELPAFWAPPDLLDLLDLPDLLVVRAPQGPRAQPVPLG